MIDRHFEQVDNLVRFGEQGLPRFAALAYGLTGRRFGWRILAFRCVGLPFRLSTFAPRLLRGGLSVDPMSGGSVKVAVGNEMQSAQLRRRKAVRARCGNRARCGEHRLPATSPIAQMVVLPCTRRWSSTRKPRWSVLMPAFVRLILACSVRAPCPLNTRVGVNSPRRDEVKFAVLSRNA